MNLVASAFRRKKYTPVLLPLLLLAAAPPARVETLQSIGGLPAHIAGIFRDPLAFQQTDAGQYFVFDRRAHAVYTIVDDTAKKIVDIGAEPGRILEPTAFDLDPVDGSFVVADAPLRRPRVQLFNAQGARLGGFTLAEPEKPRLVLESTILNGIGSIHYTAGAILVNRPESGALVSELGPYGTPTRSFGELRATGHEADRDLHLALNVGLSIPDPTGGSYFVFASGVPAFRKYDAKGALVFERHIEGPEVDQYLRAMPTEWPTRRTDEGDVLPIVPPAVRTAGVDRQGRLWIALTSSFTYVYDTSGDKVRTVQFRGAGLVSPNSLFFTRDGRILATPGCYAFRVPSP